MEYDLPEINPIFTALIDIVFEVGCSVWTVPTMQLDPKTVNLSLNELEIVVRRKKMRFSGIGVQTWGNRQTRFSVYRS